MNNIKENVLISIVIITSLFSCNKQPQDSPNIYVYGTEQFDIKSNELKYSLNDAIDIYCNYMFEVQKKDSIDFYIQIIYNDNYIFPESHYNLKTGNYSLNGYWLDGKTGCIKKVSNGEIINILIENPGMSYKKITKEEFYRNKEKQKP